MKMNIFLLYALFGVSASTQIHNAVETEMFAIPISPNLFNWTYQEYEQQYRFHASLLGKPELPPWLRYIYSRRHHSGFIFGTPPRGTKSAITVVGLVKVRLGKYHQLVYFCREAAIGLKDKRARAINGSRRHTNSGLRLEVIGLNNADYETRRVLLTLAVRPKDSMAHHEVQLKIDNLNVEDLLDLHKMSRLKDILRLKLWTESNQDLYATFLASAIDLGARLPLKPSDGEGLVVRLGSAAPFSGELKRLREEVRPLSRLPSCPRDYKRTTVERLFRDAGFTLDWCRFELFNTVYKERTTEHLEYLTEIPNDNNNAKSFKALNERDKWSAPSLHALPSRSYTKQLTATVAIPLLLLLLAIAALTAVLCFHYAAIAHKSGKVEICRYGTANTEQTQVPDNASTKSIGVSPNNSLARPYSPKSTTNLAGSYNRPQPPPYANNLHHRRSTADRTSPSTRGHTPEHRNLVLEESIKLLNEANISNADFGIKDPIVDLADGTEDYVPIKDGYVTMKGDLDDIDVPELSKYGLGGVAI